VQRFRGRLVFKAHRLCVSLNSRLESNKEEEGYLQADSAGAIDGQNTCRRIASTPASARREGSENGAVVICQQNKKLIKLGVD